VNAAYPTAWTAHAFLQLGNNPLYMVFPGGGLLNGNRPANPFVARQRRQTLPDGAGLGGGREGFVYVGWQFVHRAASQFLYAHTRILPQQPF